MISVTKTLSPNFESRNGHAPRIIVLHYTGTQTAQDAADYYLGIKTDPVAGRISPHYMIDYDGAISQFVEEDQCAWHAGRSWWQGTDRLNPHSIGIELVNPGHGPDYKPFTPAQMQSLLGLTTAITARWGIAPDRVVGHSDIAPATDRKRPDPGELMEWFWLAARGIGLWPQPEMQDVQGGAVWMNDKAALRQALNDYGYDPRVTQDEALAAFQRHFQPEAYHNGHVGRVDVDTVARLHWLLRHRSP